MSFWSAPEQTVKQAIEMPVNWDAISLTVIYNESHNYILVAFAVFCCVVPTDFAHILHGV